MSHFEITGGVALHGEVRVGGAKNAALPIMAAAILAEEPVRLENVPRLTDVRTQSQVLRCLGMHVARTADGGLLLETVDPTPVRARDELVRRMRASFCVLGPLLARRGRAVVPLPGGCNIGNRPVDLHLKGLAALGAEHAAGARLRRRHGPAIGRRNDRPLRPERSHRDRHGQRDERRRARPGHDAHPRRGRRAGNRRSWAIFSIALGAQIDGLGTSTIRIEGVDQLGGATHRLIPDRIEAATLLMAAAITGGSATVTGVVPEHLHAVLAKLRSAGPRSTVGDDRVSIAARRSAPRRRRRGRAISGLSHRRPGPMDGADVRGRGREHGAKTACFPAGSCTWPN